MPKKNLAKLALEILKGHGVEISAEVATAVAEELNEQLQLELEGQTPGEGQIIVKEDAWKKRGADLVTLRQRAHTAEGRVEELEQTFETGESHLKKENQVLRDKLTKIEPLHDKLLEGKRGEWTKLQKEIPEDLQKKLHWPEKEGAQLSDEQVLENLTRLDDWRDLNVPGVPGVPAAGEDPPVIPKDSPTGKHPVGGGEDLDELTGAQLLAKGYEANAAKSGK